MPLDPRTRTWVLVAAGACVAPLLLQLPRTLALGIAIAAIAIALGSLRRPAANWVRVGLALVLTAAVLATMGLNIGRDTGCAMLAAMLAVKPAETVNVRDARSLLGFALFAPFATFLLDQGPLSLAFGLVAVVLVLLAMQRLSDIESHDARDGVGGLQAWRRVLGVGRLIVLGLPFALAAFWLFPRLAAPLWGVPERALGRPGLADTMSPGRWEEMLLDDTPAARVRFFGTVPPRNALYFRGPVLTEFDGRTWSRANWQIAYQASPIRQAGTTWDYEIALEPTDRRQLVALDVPLSTPANASMGSDRSLRVERPLDAVTRWRMRSGAVAQFDDALPQLVRTRNLQLPAGFNPRTVAMARQWRREAGADDAAIVARALALIRRDFAYTLEVSLAGRDAVDQFLFVDKRGYCEQFSSSFVVLMRAAGIPARVVAGYAGADHNPIGDYWIVRRSDAHAWAEVWLPNRGWTRIDPTAAVAPERVFDTLEDRAALSGDLLANLTPVYDVGDWLVNGWNDFVLGFNADRQRSMFKPLGLDAIGAERLLLLFALVALGGLAVTVWLLSRDVRERDPLLRAWHRLGTRYAKLGLGRAPHEPALDWSRRVHAARSGGDPALVALGERFSRWRYGAAPAGATPEPLGGLLRDLAAHRP